MESNNKNYVELEVNKVLTELDCNRILTEDDRLELKDHFLNEVEHLTTVGLNEAEALLVAKKRFGVLEDVNEEYQKVKPGFDLLRYGIIGVVTFCMVKIFLITINMTSQLFWLIYYQFDPNFVRDNVILDIPLRLICIFLMGFFAIKLMKKVSFDKLASLWKYPLFYLLAEGVNRLYQYAVLFDVFNADWGLLIEFGSTTFFINYLFIFTLIIIASYKMYKMKVLDMEYV